jgi:ERCC4-type nuclease
MVIITDSREQKNKHVTDYFESQKIVYMSRTLKTGDYSAFIPRNDDLGITRDIHLQASIERKNSIDELAQSITDRTRFENELIRASRSHFE